MTAAAPTVVVLGGGRADRADAVSHLARGSAGTVLVLTSMPELLAADLDTGEDGRVEVRVDDPTARVASYLTGVDGDPDAVLRALGTGSDSPLAAVLGWEYARRAAASGAWETVVVELDGTTSALRRLAAPGELAVFVESHRPAHQRFAAMAAGDLAPADVREAHRLSDTTEAVARFLAGGVRVVVTGEPEPEATRVLALADLARGATGLQVTRESGGGRYLAVVPAGGRCTDPVVEADRLVLRLDGVHVAAPLPALLRRCVPDGWWRDDDGRIVVAFVPDPALWPPTLDPSVAPGGAR